MFSYSHFSRVSFIFCASSFLCIVVISLVIVSFGRLLFAFHYAFLVAIVALLCRIFAFHWEICICVFWTFIMMKY
ncbi:hypothetical protein PHAVU_004G114500 [Phaseolus vulgaris]|uniref:Uncharacterized protein n=1 Tax=Phaseolus vulgaris TaxID=3885 RepID=V7C273_PHAVU|nr:hypothetical protein PHAVU_004G114500g [Phaseolus vulgaris]ESW24252.1 hypothetical protein PHAVU_004G114500g [Phaseolus vulgaris]